MMSPGFGASFIPHFGHRIRIDWATHMLPRKPLILLVDDFDDARDIYVTYLSYHGYPVESVSNGQEAIAAVRARRPGLILLDLRMPGLTGTETMLALRSDPDVKDIPIVAFTAHALDDERAAALSAGFDAVIAKPCLPDDLLALIDALLARWSNGRPGPELERGGS